LIPCAARLFRQGLAQRLGLIVTSGWSQAHNLVYSHLRYDDSNEIRKHQSADDEKAGIDALNNRFKGMKLAFDIVFDEVDIMKTVDSFLFSK
jgi:hypothetical protein